MMTWQDDDTLSWGDTNKRLEIEMEDGKFLVGTLNVEEIYTDDDFWPEFSLLLDDGTEVFLGDMKRWREVA